MRLIVAAAFLLAGAGGLDRFLQQRADESIIVRFDAPRLVLLGVRLKAQALRFLQQQFAHRQRSRRFQPCGLRIGRRMVLDLARDRLGLDLDAVDEHLAEAGRRRDERLGAAAAAASLAGARHDGGLALLLGIAEVDDVEAPAHAPACPSSACCRIMVVPP